MEVNFESNEEKELKHMLTNKAGWLNVEIIDGFLYNLQKECPSMLFCGCTESFMITKGKSMRLLWKNDVLSNIETITIHLINHRYSIT